MNDPHLLARLDDQYDRKNKLAKRVATIANRAERRALCKKASRGAGPGGHQMKVLAEVLMLAALPWLCCAESGASASLPVPDDPEANPASPRFLLRRP